MINKVYIEITEHIQKLLKENLISNINFPYQGEGEIKWHGYKSIAYTLKNQDYSTVYNAIASEKDYNFQLLDGALFQFMYRFDTLGNITEHRLAYYPNPNSAQIEDLKKYIEEYFDGLNIFSDIFRNYNNIVPLRFDFSSDDKKFVEHFHSYSHLSISNNKNCRIPIVGPLSPGRFLRFVFSNFYNDLFKHVYSSNISIGTPMPKTITKKESEAIYIQC